MKASSKVNNGHSFRLFTPLLSKQPKPTERGRAGRRRQRIEKKLLILQEEDEAAKKVDVEVDPAQYDMLTFAEKWFNNHPKDITGLGTFTMRRKRFSRQARKVLWNLCVCLFVFLCKCVCVCLSVCLFAEEWEDSTGIHPWEWPVCRYSSMCILLFSFWTGSDTEIRHDQIHKEPEHAHVPDPSPWSGECQLGLHHLEGNRAVFFLTAHSSAQDQCRLWNWVCVAIYSECAKLKHAE